VAAFCFSRSRLFEIARLLGRFDDVARFIENPESTFALPISRAPASVITRAGAAMTHARLGENYLLAEIDELVANAFIAGIGQPGVPSGVIIEQARISFLRALRGPSDTEREAL
jgi:hypothetical protein